MLDKLSSRDQGVDTQIRPEMFDTQFPTNVDGHDVTLHMTRHPEPEAGFTDITACIMSGHIMTEMLWPRDMGKSSDVFFLERNSHHKFRQLSQ
jgi:hypothetical protein